MPSSGFAGSAAKGPDVVATDDLVVRGDSEGSVPYLAGRPARSWHLADLASVGCRGIDGPVPPPLWIKRLLRLCADDAGPPVEPQPAEGPAVVSRSVASLRDRCRAPQVGRRAHGGAATSCAWIPRRPRSLADGSRRVVCRARSSVSYLAGSTRLRRAAPNDAGPSQFSTN